MRSRVRIIYLISLALIINLAFSTIERFISTLILSPEISIKSVFYLLRGFLPEVLGILALILLIVGCKKYYETKEELNIRNNLFFIGSYLLVTSLLNFFYIPINLYSLKTISQQISDSPFLFKHMFTIISNISFVVIKIIIGIIMVIRDINKEKQIKE